MTWKKSINPKSLSLCSHYLRMIFKETNQTLATGSGFIYEYDDYMWLITNGHNLTGINPATKQRLSSHAGFPTEIKTQIRIISEEREGQMAHSHVDIKIYEDDSFLEPTWLIHPDHGYAVDVVAIPMNSKQDFPENVKLFPINKADFQKDFSPDVSDEAFILGYPLDIIGNHELPIWKRASIATEVSIDIDGLPKILVDTATRSGMSGSAVIYQRHGIHKSPDGDMGKTIIGTVQDFLGVYSGRIGANDVEAQLGIVWKKQVIEEIIQGATKGTIEFQKLS